MLLGWGAVVRAKIVLLAAEGLENKEIGERLDMPRPVVSYWRKRSSGVSGDLRIAPAEVDLCFPPLEWSPRWKRWPVSPRPSWVSRVSMCWLRASLPR